MKIVGVVVCTNRVLKMKEHLTFCREFSKLCIEDRVVVDRVVNFERERLLKTQHFDG